MNGPYVLLHRRRRQQSEMMLVVHSVIRNSYLLLSLILLVKREREGERAPKVAGGATNIIRLKSFFTSSVKLSLHRPIDHAQYLCDTHNRPPFDTNIRIRRHISTLKFTQLDK